jgi:O-antigen/teichoic acid export membrane protein
MATALKPTLPPESEPKSVSNLVSGELKTLARQSSHYLVGLVAGLAIGMISFPIFTRVFTVAQYGILDLAQKAAAILVILSKGGMQNAALRFYNKPEFEANPRSAQSYYSTMFFGVVCASGIVALWFIGIAKLEPRIFALGPLENLIYLIASLAVLRGIGAILWAFLRIEERTKLFNVTSVGTKAATVAVICALLPVAGRTVQSYLIGIILVEICFVVALTLSLQRRRVLHPSSFAFELYRAGVVYGTPLVVYEFAFAVLASADRLLVQWYLGSDALGFYSVAYGLAQHANELLFAPLMLAIVPIYLRIWASDGLEKTTGFLTLAFDLFLIAAAGMLAVATASSHSFLVLVTSPKYADADRLIPVILAGLLAYAAHVFLAAGLLIHKRTLQMAGLLVFAAALNIGLNCLLLPRMGLMGGAIATLLSYAVCTGLLGQGSRQFVPLRIKLLPLLKYVAAACVACLAGTRVELGAAALNLLGKSGMTVLTYVGCLYLADARVRSGAASAGAWVRTAMNKGVCPTCGIYE